MTTKIPYTKIVVGAVVVIGAVIIGKKFSSIINKFIKEVDEKGDIKKEIKTKGTLPKTQYTDLANAIQKAFDPVGIFGAGTDENAIYGVFRLLNNNDDFLILKKEYGVRPYKDYTYNPFGETYNFNMPQAILFEDENSEMKNRINKILSIKGITYRI